MPPKKLLIDILSLKSNDLVKINSDKNGNLSSDVELMFKELLLDLT